MIAKVILKPVQKGSEQYPDPIKFRWDNSELGFDSSNHKDYDSLSIPLFSVDHKRAVIMIESVYDFLGGGGNTYVYVKENNKWDTETSSFKWYH